MFLGSKNGSNFDFRKIPCDYVHEMLFSFYHYGPHIALFLFLQSLSATLCTRTHIRQITHHFVAMFIFRHKHRSVGLRDPGAKVGWLHLLRNYNPKSYPDSYLNVMSTMKIYIYLFMVLTQNPSCTIAPSTIYLSVPNFRSAPLPSPSQPSI